MLMISDVLAGNRKGRFLQSLLDAEAVSLEALPDQGLLLLTGEELKTRSLSGGEEVDPDGGNTDLIDWAEQAGCVLIVMPPHQEGSLFAGLDWHLLSLSEVPTANDDFTQLITFDVRDQLLGTAGERRREQAHCWQDGSPHTRFYRKHANSGMLVLTTLPLWSISLLDEADNIRLWLQWFLDHAGKPAVVDRQVPVTAPLTREDLSLLVCAYGYASGDLERIKIMSQTAGLLNLSALEAEQRWPLLIQAGLITGTGLSARGVAELEASPFLMYAEQLRRMQQ